MVHGIVIVATHSVRILAHTGTVTPPTVRRLVERDEAASAEHRQQGRMR